MRWRRESQIRMCITVVGWLFLPARCHPEALSLPIPKVENLWVEVNTESPSQLLTIGKTDSTEKMNLLQETDKKMNHHHPPFFLPSITTSVLQSQFLCIPVSFLSLPGMVKGGMAASMSCSMEIWSNTVLSVSCGDYLLHCGPFQSSEESLVCCLKHLLFLLLLLVFLLLYLQHWLLINI